MNDFVPLNALRHIGNIVGINQAGADKNNRSHHGGQ